MNSEFPEQGIEANVATDGLGEYRGVKGPEVAVRVKSGLGEMEGKVIVWEENNLKVSQLEDNAIPRSGEVRRIIVNEWKKYLLSIYYVPSIVVSAGCK